MIAVFASQSVQRVAGDLNVTLGNIEIDAFQFVAEHSRHRVRCQQTRGIEDPVGGSALTIARVGDKRVAKAEVSRSLGWNA